MSWHLDESIMQRYLDGTIDVVTLQSIEAHVEGCPSCRSLVPADPEWLGHSWRAVAGQVRVPRPGPVERLLTRSGIGAPLARLMVGAPSSRRSWWFAVVGALTFAVAASHATAADDASLLLFLALAPLLPVGGVALAYGPGVDPLHELSVATPMSGLRLMLIRTSVVLGATVGLGILAVPLLPAVSWTAVGWLLPALALTAVSLALGSWLPQQWASGLVAGLWAALVVVLAIPAPDPLLLFRADVQPWFIIAGALGGVVVGVRRQSFELGGVR